ncbi:MAG TPA: endonuclease/exonuclease/phosphatase family protein, partial [Flavisolibacter sp.]|nr:endonuclease/exonuclease/phosphatase family protein [Flavisolibacter sp.]
GTETADIYLLQEMDEKGVREIANSLSLNYVYIPVVQKTSSKKDIGNAILSKGPIACFEKLLLPHAKPLSNSRRLVTIAEVTIHREKILVYSVQTETVVMSNKKRMEQVDAIIAHARMRLPGYKYVLIGGDFNTLFTRSSRLAVAKFRESGFEWSTETVSTTARAFFGVIKPKHDYIFSKGLKFINASKMETSKSSDHYPVLATFSMKS